MGPKTHEPGVVSNGPGNSGRVAPPKQSARNLKGYKRNGLKRDSENEMSDSEKNVDRQHSSLYEKCFDWIMDNLIPGESEKYSIWCFIMGAVGCILCFIPFYRSDPSMKSGGILPGQLVFNGATGTLEDPSFNLEDSLDSNQFNVALLLSVIIAIPMLLDVLMDTYYVFRKDSGRKLHWFVRLFLVASLTVPSILLLTPSTFASGLASVDGYLCVQASKRISITACMFAFIAHEKLQESNSNIYGGRNRRVTVAVVPSADGNNSSSQIIFDHHKLGFKACMTLITYMLYELFWLYSYSLGSNANRGLTANAPLRVTGAFCLCLSFLQLVHIMLIWGWRFMSKTTRSWIRKAAFLTGYFARAVQPVGQQMQIQQQQQSPIQSAADPRPSIAKTLLAKARGSHSNKHSNINPQSQNPSRDDSEQSAALNAYLHNGNQAQWTSRDFSLALFFSAMLLIPTGGLIIAAASGNSSINSLQASAYEISGFVYLQMCFTTLILVLPGYLARYELSQALATLHEKENFIAQVSIEVRNPLNDVLLNINSVQHELAALVPPASDPNSAAERVLFMSVIETINEVAHSTEVALSTFTDLITINGLDQGQAVILDKQPTHPWRFFRDVAKPFEIEAKFKRVGFGMTCQDYSKGWSDERSVEVDRHKISQVLRTLILCSFKATQAGGNVHVTIALVEHTPAPLLPPPPPVSNFTIRALGAGLGLRSQAFGQGVKSSSLDEAGNPVLQPAGGGAGSVSSGGRRGEQKNSDDHHVVNDHSRRRLATSSPGYSNEWLVLEVIDNGKALHRREVDGSLLRLRACSKMVELHGGSMHVSQRAHGKAGATFQIKIPCYRLKGGRDSGSNHISNNINNISNNNNQTGRVAAAATGINLLTRHKADSSGNSSDHGCFGMRNDFAKPFNPANNHDGDDDVGNDQLDWFVPDYVVDLNAASSNHVPSSNHDPSQKLRLDPAESEHSEGSKGLGGYLGNLLSGSNSRNSNRGSGGGGNNLVGGSGGRSGRSIRMVRSSMKGSHAISDSDYGSRPQSLAEQHHSLTQPKRSTIQAANNNVGGAARGAGTGDSTAGGGVVQAAAVAPTTSIKEPVTVIASMMDLLGQLGQASMASNVSSIVRGFGSQSRQASRRQSSNCGDGHPVSSGRHSRVHGSSRNSLADDVQQQLQSQASRRGSKEEGTSSMLKSPSGRVINDSPSKNTSSKEAANKAAKKGTDLSVIVTGDLRND